ncbi:MAG: enterotoxin [Edaphobacter sp.]|uniref:enterotoxin n=1 Tax=Edaphobacter sp. TaxID=1934404 RepID=UPI002392B1C1|nr:enterotoxin [Edaphobacter sp.]MDE1176618.1 enterotoxin [Edaphobacter sp.]
MCSSIVCAGEVFGTRTLQADVRTDSGHLSLAAVKDLRTGSTLKPGEVFVLVLDDGQRLASSTMHLEHPLVATALPADAKAARAAAHVAGREVCTDLSDAASGTRVHWCLIARGETAYLRQELTVTAGKDALPIAEVQMFRFHEEGAKVSGTVAGSPIVREPFYVGFEHPLSYSTVEQGEVTAGLKRTLPLRAGQSISYSSVIGTVRPGQLRRDFLEYVELERAHPYRTFLHYNTWYDLGFGERFGADGVLDRMHSFGEELVRKRGVTMDSFLMDDGWDNTRSLWKFDSQFPDGFTPLRATAKSYGFGIGVWLSPWGGYSTEKKERIAYGTSQNYEIVKNGYALSGPKYYAAFEAACLNFIERYGVNQFKFDGTGNAGQVFPGSIFDSDFSAAIHLIERLRQQENGLFVNLTTGTKPSPFWLRYADSIWRSGEDHSFDGEGSWRQKWITYRDEQTYRNIVEKGPLFPLNSLMLHGMIYAEKAQHLGDDPNNDFPDEVHSYFGSGTQLQEMYITPSLLSSANWDVLAESARWSRENASILRDTHWVGGDPGKGEVYGWASWNANRGILVLRNPTPREQSISLDVKTTFELPVKAQQHYRMRSPWKSDAGKPEIAWNAGAEHHFVLKPFQVLTLESR